MYLVETKQKISFDRHTELWNHACLLQVPDCRQQMISVTAVVIAHLITLPDFVEIGVYSLRRLHRTLFS